jgi:steroid delta-isomerase-like uncharacterized protein
MALLFLVLAPVCAAWAAMPAQLSLASASEQERNKAVARRVFEEILGQGKFQAADEIYARDFVNHGLHQDANLDADQAAARWEKTTCPDLTVTPLMMVAEGELVSVVWLARGTNTRAAGWIPATGVKIELRGMTMWRIADGRIREEWTSFDMLGVARQLVEQLKWQIAGVTAALLMLLWLAGWGVRKTWVAVTAKNL